MRVYLVRHGKSEEDLGGKRQYPTSKLAEVGQKQAEKAALKLLSEKFDYIYASPWDRARETAEIIARHIGREIELHPHIHEIQSPEALQGADKDGEVNKQFLKEMIENESNPNWKFMGGGESLSDVLNRTNKFIDELIEKHQFQSVLVVSHGAFIGCLIANMIWGDDIPTKNIRVFAQSLSLHNTSISVMEYDEEKKRWRVDVINDHQHISGL